MGAMALFVSTGRSRTSKDGKSGHSAAERPLRGPVSGCAEGDVMANLSAERNAAKSANSSTLGIFLEPQDFYYIAKYERRALGINGERG
jgi:hypothetical protein